MIHILLPVGNTVVGLGFGPSLLEEFAPTEILHKVKLCPCVNMGVDVRSGSTVSYNFDKLKSLENFASFPLDTWGM